VLAVDGRPGGSFGNDDRNERFDRFHRYRFEREWFRRLDGKRPHGRCGERFNGFGRDTSCASTCGVGQVCVEDWAIDYAYRVDTNDAGECPDGDVMDTFVSGWCIPGPRFHCAPLPAGCDAGADATAVDLCTCGALLCESFSTCAAAGANGVLCEALTNSNLD
jgi:hypothetical protein